MAITKVLIANRGEIAVRVLRACRDLGLPAVVAFSEADRDSLPVKLADEAICIGPAEARKSYLNQPAVISAAMITGCDAIHPGYGFLSEDATFAEACAAHELTFIGPRPEVLERFASKYAVRRMLAANGLPTVPGSRGIVTDLSDALEQAGESGYPVLLKPSAGGGGRGMRLVRSPREMETSLPLARSEAQAAFGDDSVYFEKWIEESRHVEVQVLVDHHGNGVHLGERDCSVQRRHQKIIEEGPSPAMDDAARERLRDVAIRSVIAAGYESAGTLEFLLDADGNFYFIEINCRIQVEHPVTEALTGIDLIVEQIRIAAGDPLSLRQDAITFRGHAIEFRINAEDPGDNFAPQTGEIESLTLPGGPGVRVDTHLFPGYEVPPFYDSLLAKLRVGRTREIARRALVAPSPSSRSAASARISRSTAASSTTTPSWTRGSARTCSIGSARPPSCQANDPSLRSHAHRNPTHPGAAARGGGDHAHPSASVSVPPRRPGRRARAGKAGGRDQAGDGQRAAVHRPLPRSTDHARVLMVEALAQTAGVAVLTLDEYRGKIGLFAGIDECRFRRLVVPGDTLRLEVTVEKLRGMFGRVRAVASVDGEIAVEATLSIIIPRDQEIAGGMTDA